MSQSGSIVKLAAAIVAAQKEVRGAKKDSENPHFKSKYADLASVWDACRDALQRHGLAVIQMPGYAEGIVTLTTRLVHESGEWIESVAGAPIEARAANAQGVGSALTYLRRYSVAAMIGVVTEDDDGNAASRPAPKREQPIKANADGEITLPGDAKKWGGWGGKPLSEVPDNILIQCSQWLRKKGTGQDLVDAINDELEQRRGASPQAGDSHPPGARVEKPLAPSTEEMPRALREDDERDALVVSVERAFRMAKEHQTIPEGKLALIASRYKALGPEPSLTQLEAILGTIEKASGQKVTP